MLRTSLMGMVVCLAIASTAQAQRATIRFQNVMQATADVTITKVGTTESQTFAIGADNVVSFSFDGDAFDIQVIPRDEAQSGYRFDAVPLRNLAANAQGQVVRLVGAFGPDQTTQVCRRGCFRRRVCKCYTVRTRGERIAVGFEANLNTGERFLVESPKMRY